MPEVILNFAKVWRGLLEHALQQVRLKIAVRGQYAWVVTDQGSLVLNRVVLAHRDDRRTAESLIGQQYASMR